MQTYIREYLDSDKEKIAELFNDFQDYIVEIDTFNIEYRAPDLGQSYLQKILQDLQENEGKFYIAEVDGEIAGFIAGKIKQYDEVDQKSSLLKIEGETTELFVVERYRSLHIGSQLMETMEKYYKQKGCEIALVNVFVPNTSARAFYKSCSYEECDINLIKKLT